MIKVLRNKRKDAEQFEVILQLDDGDHFFTARAAKELRDKLSYVLEEIKKKVEK